MELDGVFDRIDLDGVLNELEKSRSESILSFTRPRPPPTIHYPYNDEGIHHLFYSGFLFHALVRGYSISFAYTLLMESSSILLSGGRLFPLLRRDILFGILFFAFRIVYHAWMLWMVRTDRRRLIIIEDSVPCRPQAGDSSIQQQRNQYTHTTNRFTPSRTRASSYGRPSWAY